jgi:tetratricopeptide (TPR) repeat protein
MNNIRKIYLIASSLIALVLGACHKYLDKKANNSFSTPSTLFDLQTILDNSGQMNNATPCFGEASADDYFLLLATYNARPDDQKKAYIWQDPLYIYNNDWAKEYLAIYNSNICLENIETIPVTVQNDSVWKSIKGSALFHRAYAFLNLAWVYSKAFDKNTSDNDPGIVLRLISDFNVPSTRSSVSTSYEQIIKDSKDAALLLPYNSTHVFRPNKAAAYGLLARIYLSMREYDSAYKYSDLCLGINNNLIDYNTITTSASVPFSQFAFNSEVIFHSSIINLFTFNLVGRGFVDTTLYKMYATNDLRKSAFFRASSGYFTFKGTYNTAATPYFSGLATDEMYLTRAECYARSGNKDAAMVDLNSLLIKRYVKSSFIPLSASSAQEALNMILVERRKELLIRGLRWMDIKRLNKEGRNIILQRKIDGQDYYLQPNDNKYALPLPIDVITQSSIQQN